MPEVGASQKPFRKLKTPGENVRAQVEINAKLAKQENKLQETDPYNKPWDVWGNTVSSYESSFLPVSGTFGSLSNLLAERSVEGGPRFGKVLDLMASDAFLNDVSSKFGLQYGLAITLGYEPDRSISQQAPNVHVQNDDLLLHSSWRRIREQMDLHGVKSFDMIVNRGEGGLHHVTYDPRVHFVLLRKAWELLSPEGGIYLGQVLEREFVEFRKYLDQLKETGIECAIDPVHQQSSFGRAFMLKKSETSPKKLPLFTPVVTTK